MSRNGADRSRARPHGTHARAATTSRATAAPVKSHATSNSFEIGGGLRVRLAGPAPTDGSDQWRVHRSYRSIRAAVGPPDGRSSSMRAAPPVTCRSHEWRARRSRSSPARIETYCASARPHLRLVLRGPPTPSRMLQRTLFTTNPPDPLLPRPTLGRVLAAQDGRNPHRSKAG